MTFVTPPRLSLLRARTKSSHAAIETVPILSRLMARDIRVAEYTAVLDAMHGFHLAFEAEIAALVADLPQAAAMLEQSRLPALRSDLAWFGLAPSPAAPPAPGFATRAEALGALYVIEGSLLGGRVIARHLTENLNVRPGAGCSYYGGTDADTARGRWHDLCALIESLDDRDGAAQPVGELMAQAACRAFDSLDRWMRRIAPVHGARPMAEAAAS